MGISCGADALVRARFSIHDGSQTYGSMYGMQKTTVYLPDDVKRALTHTASVRGVSEAELVREAIRQLTSASAARRPRLPLFKSGRSRLAERIDEALNGFGER